MILLEIPRQKLFNELSQLEDLRLKSSSPAEHDKIYGARITLEWLLGLTDFPVTDRLK